MSTTRHLNTALSDKFVLGTMARYQIVVSVQKTMPIASRMGTNNRIRIGFIKM